MRSLADEVGVSAPFLSDLEHGRRQTDKYGELAEAFGVPEEELRAFDARLTAELKDWLAANPKLVTVLKEMQASGRPAPIEDLRELAKKAR